MSQKKKRLRRCKVCRQSIFTRHTELCSVCRSILRREKELAAKWEKIKVIGDAGIYAHGR